jgi:hypothetical protein
LLVTLRTIVLPVLFCCRYLATVGCFSRDTQTDKREPNSFFCPTVMWLEINNKVSSLCLQPARHVYGVKFVDRCAYVLCKVLKLQTKLQMFYFNQTLNSLNQKKLLLTTLFPPRPPLTI